MLVSWGHNIIGGVNRVIEPVGESRSDLLIFQQLADRLGIGPEMAGAPRGWLAPIFTPLPNPGGGVAQGMEGPGRCPGAPMGTFAAHAHPTKPGPFELIPPPPPQPRGGP